MRVCTLCRRRRRPWRLGSPTIAGRCTNCCHCTYRRRVGHHPSNVGGPRICSNVLLSGGVETTISCGAITGVVVGKFTSNTWLRRLLVRSQMRRILPKLTDVSRFTSTVPSDPIMLVLWLVPEGG